jgi:hypothetical protein
MERSSSNRGVYLALARMILAHPTLRRDALSSAWAFRAKDWYRRPPLLALPPASYLRWRMETAYGDADVVPPPEDFGRYLRWARRMRKLARRR